MNYENKETFRRSWYSLSANRHVTTLGGLRSAVNSDICVIGGGFTGLSTAYELLRRGYAVTLLEAGPTPGFDASGRNGGHVLRGLAKSPSGLAARFGRDAARTMCDLSLQGIDLIKTRMAEHAIDCDFHHGHLTAALTARHLDDLRAECDDWQEHGFAGMRIADRAETQDLVRAPAYIGGLFDSTSGHFHPLNYALGLADAAIAAGLRLYTDSRVTHIDAGANGGPATVHVQGGGSVRAQHVVVAGAIALPQMQKPLAHSMVATAHMIATAPLSDRQMAETLPGNIAVADANFVMNYFRRSADNRLLFGGSCNYTGTDLGFEHRELRARMLRVFPHLRDVAVTNCWHGPLDLTANRLPEVGSLAPNVLFAHGFGGHGVALTNIMGVILADAVHGQLAHFDIFKRIGHIPFVGGKMTKRPLFVLGMWWYMLRDRLGL